VNDLMAQLTEISGFGADLIWAAFLVFLRVGAAMALLPAFGEQTVPQRVRLVVALAFTAVVAPAVTSAVPESEAGMIVPVAAEVMAGLLIGIGLRFFVIALQMAGAIIGQATSLSQLFGGAGPEPQPAIGNLLVMAGLALAVMAGLHVRFAALLILSYDLLPVGKIPGAADVARWGLSQISHAFSLAFSLAAPFTISALLYNMALGVINRAMPSLMVSFVGAPALTLGGLVLLAVVAPLALALWVEALRAYLAQPFRISP
jgi:flagellar biosynthesis protein FliR